jgi:DNA polymerase III epsilon subunit-like protein
VIALVMDTETTGLIENRIVKNERLPELIEFYGAVVDLDNDHVLDEQEHLVRPTQALSDQPAPGPRGRKSKKTITDITGISNEMLVSHPKFSEVADRIIAIIEAAPLVIAHNASYDQEILDIEAARLGRQIHWPRLLCTVEQTVHLTGKRLTLTDLHNLLFEEKFADAHRAKADTQALIRCCRELVRRGEL